MRMSMAVRSAVVLLAVCLTVCLTASVAPAQKRDRNKAIQKLIEYNEAIKELEATILAPDPADVAAARDFLALPDTGIIRLLPREVYDSTSGRNTALHISGGGAYFSFATRSHEYGHGDDIELAGGEFSSGFAGADYGFLVPIGKTALASLSTDDPTVAALAAFVPPSQEPGAREIQRALWQGYAVSPTIAPVKERAPVQLKTTYVLRSINYDTSDVLVAFSPVRQDADGSVIVLWRLLRTYPVPKLER